MGAAPTSAPMMLMTYRAMAAISDAFWMKSARLALRRSLNPRVRNYTRMSVRDHSMTSQALMGGVQMAALGMIAPALDNRHAAMLNQLASASGSQFDRLYGQMIVELSREALALHSRLRPGWRRSGPARLRPAGDAPHPASSCCSAATAGRARVTPLE